MGWEAVGPRRTQDVTASRGENPEDLPLVETSLSAGRLQIQTRPWTCLDLHWC